ncbi:potassium channel family protein [Deinococcus sp. YIM 77859]|uniref:potassium channel family protein n=1 Tax=Deinococcus sp. YIM 77859 TaxID=1540221 RepID=UPI0005526920|nr:potassium channel family protein [Deinococcus sp. YIM 77859]
MGFLLWLPGTLLILLALGEALAGAMQSGESPLTRSVHHALHSALRGVSRLTGRRGPLVWSGLTLVIGTFVVWLLLTWLGWTLIFLSRPGALVGASTGTPADPWDVVYFVGYTLSTLGLGDLRAVYTGWRLLTDLTALNGFILITFAITFIVPLAQAQEARRIFALRLHRSGATAQGLVLTAWHDHPKGLQGLLDDVEASLLSLDVQHWNYPALHRFHTALPAEALELALPALDEALHLIEFALDVPPPKRLRVVRASIDSLLDTYRRLRPGLNLAPPPLPDLTPLREAGLPLRPSAEVEARFAALTERRRLLRRMAEGGGFSWSQVER